MIQKDDIVHHLDLSRTLALSGKLDESRKILDMLVKDGDARAVFNMGWHLARDGKLLESQQYLSVGRELNVYGLPPLKTDRPIPKPSTDVKGKKVLFRGEGGYGDTFAMLRFAKNYKDMGAHVTVACQKEAFSLLRTIPYIDNLIQNEYAAGADHDYWVPCMSAIVALGIDQKDLSGKPYIPRPKSLPLGGDFKVGLRWAGNPKFEDEQYRKFPKEMMLPLLDVPGVTFYSLQRDYERIEHDNLVDLEPYMVDWLATAKLIAGLDLVITSCTSIAHLAGAMGVPVWIIIPVLPYYMWALPGSKTPWYDSAAIFRQEKHGIWDAPFAKVKSELQKLVNKSDRKAA